MRARKRKQGSAICRPTMIGKPRCATASRDSSSNGGSVAVGVTAPLLQVTPLSPHASHCWRARPEWACIGLDHYTARRRMNGGLGSGRPVQTWALQEGIAPLPDAR
jgi:hypothetical protein